MSERITYADVERIAATISENLPDDYKLTPNRRNGYVAVDIYRGDDCESVATVGTARETNGDSYDMFRTIWDANGNDVGRYALKPYDYR